MSPPVGRFAPTPSGPLHLGSLLTALGSWLSARAAGGRWMLRIDDLDTPRVQPSAESTILRQLDAHGLHWDGAIRRQSQHLDEYAAALTRLRDQGRVYACTCTRAQLQQAAGGEDAVYPGTCREAGRDTGGAALRFAVGTGELVVNDEGLGRLTRRLEREVGDFVVRRRDGQFAYQLTCAVDEAAEGVTEVVRGADLIDSTFRQVQLLHALGLPVARYRHLPLVLGPDGRKLSKQNGAEPLDLDRVAQNLLVALRLLGQPRVEPTADPAAILEAAVRAWDPTRIPIQPLPAP